MHCPRLRRHLRRSTRCAWPAVAAICSTLATIGTAPAPPTIGRSSSRNGRGGSSRSALSGVWRFRELLPFAPPEKVVTIGEGQTLLQPLDGRRQVRRPGARPAVPAIRGDEPLGQLQRQRHDGGVHACPHDRRPAGRLRLDRQHQRLAGRLLRGHAADEGRHLHRLGQDLLRQALAGARLRRADRADRRRLRRRHAARARSLAAAGHLSGQQRQSVPAGRAEDDHVSRAGSAALGSARLDRRARRQPRATRAPSARRSPSCASSA